MRLRALLILPLLVGLHATWAADAAQPIAWSALAPLPQMRSAVATGAFVNEVAIVGGVTRSASGQLAYSADGWLYDLKTDAWTALPRLPRPIAFAASATVGKRLYIIGGTNGTRAVAETVILARAGRRWEWLRGPALPAPRVHAAAVTMGSQIWLIGGAPDADLAGDFLRDILVFDVAHPNLGWQAKRAMPGAGRADSAAVAYGGKLYLFGGLERRGGEPRPCDDALAYDPAADRWHRLPDVPCAGAGWRATAVGGPIFLMGGRTVWPASQGRATGVTDQVLTFDPVAEAFTQAGSLPLQLTDFALAALGDGRLLIAGGNDATGQTTNLAVLGTLR